MTDDDDGPWFLFLRGDIHPEAKDEFDFLRYAPREDSGAHATRYEADFSIYLMAEDEVRDFKVSGLTGEFSIHEPSLEDRQFVSAMTAAKMLLDNGLDMHDFKQILDWALIGMVNVAADSVPGETTYDNALFKAVDNMYHTLGGME